MEQIFHIQQLFVIFLAIVLRGCVDALTVAAFELADIDLDDCIDENDIPDSFQVVRTAPVTSILGLAYTFPRPSY